MEKLNHIEINQDKNNDSNQEAYSNALNSLEKEFYNKDLEEEHVGILAFMSKTSEPFVCTLKHKYSDFLVNEIDFDGNVLWGVKPSNQIIKEIKIKEEEPKQEEVLSVKSKEENLQENLKKFQSLNILNDIDFNQFSDFIGKYSLKELSNDSALYIEYINDKAQRKLLHETVRELFPFLDSTTEAEKIKLFIMKGNLNKKRITVPNPSKKYLHCVMLKRNLDTIFAVNYLSKYLKRSFKTVRIAGNKDKRGITTQGVSIFNINKEDVEKVTRNRHWDRKIELSGFEYKDNELKLGLLKGNQFCVVLRFLDLVKGEDINKIVELNISNLKEKGFINYFGLQRFGSGNVPTHVIGKEIMRKNWKQAILQILTTQAMKEAIIEYNKKLFRNSTEEKPCEYFHTLEDIFNTGDPSRTINELIRNLPRKSDTEKKILMVIRSHLPGLNYYNAFKALNRQLQLIYPHAYQSYIWNKVVSLRIEKYGDSLLIGDIVKKKEVQNIELPVEEFDFQEDEVNEELVECLIEKESTKGAFERDFEYVNEENIKDYTIEDLYIPLFGVEVKYPKNETYDLIMKELKEDGIDLGLDTNLHIGPGSYRKVIQIPKEVKHEFIEHDDPNIDLQSEYYNIESHPKVESTQGKFKSLRVQFQLNQSTYATMLFRELTRQSSAYSQQLKLTNKHK